MTTDGKRIEMGQNKFHGSLKFNNNNIKFKESVIGKSSNQESVISIHTNAKKIEMTGNAIDMGKIVSAHTTLKPLINVTGLTGHTVQPKGNGYTINTGTEPGNLPSMLRSTQPFVFAGNKITVDSVDLMPAAAAKPLQVLSSQFTLRYARDNEFITKNPLNLATSTDGMDAYEDAKYSADVTATGGPLKDDARTNFALIRMAEETTEDSSKELPVRTTAIVDEGLPLGQTVEDKPLVNVSVARKVGKAAVKNAIRAADNKGGRNVLDPYPTLKKDYYKLENLTDDKDGLLLGDYIVSTGTSAGSVLESKKEIAMSGVTINDLTRYEKMPVALKDAFEIEYEIANPDARPVERTVRVGTLRTVYDAVKTEEEINFEITEEKTDTLKKGEKEIKTPGQKGKKEIVYRDLKNAKTGAVLEHTAAVERVIKKPVAQVVLVGTKEDATAIDTTNLQNKITEAETALNDPKTVDNAKKTALQKLVDDAEVALTDENLTPDAQQKHIEALKNPEKQVERKKPSSGGGSGGGGGSYVAPTPTNPITPMNPTIPNNPNNNSNNNTSNQNNNNSNNTNHTKPIITPEGTLSTQQGVTPSTQTTSSGQKIYNLSGRITDYICPAIVQAYPYNELVVQDISNSSFQDDISALMMFRGMEKDEMNLGQTYEEYKKYGVVNNVTQFQPSRNVTRAEFVKMLVRSLSCRYTYLGTDTGFSDVDQNQWYAEYIKFAVENKWINGYKDGNFRPNAPITRDEAAKILTRAIQLSTQNSNYTTSFSDVPASSEFIPYIETLKSHGIMKGRNSNTFAPKEFIPRTETSRMIYRTFFGGNV